MLIEIQFSMSSSRAKKQQKVSEQKESRRKKRLESAQRIRKKSSRKTRSKTKASEENPPEKKREFSTLAFLTGFVFVPVLLFVVSVPSLLGQIGLWVGEGLRDALGVGAWLWPLWLLGVCCQALRLKITSRFSAFWVGLSILCLQVLVALVWDAGGLLGQRASQFLVDTSGLLGASLVALLGFSCCVLLASGIGLQSIWKSCCGFIDWLDDTFGQSEESLESYELDNPERLEEKSFEPNKLSAENNIEEKPSAFFDETAEEDDAPSQVQHSLWDRISGVFTVKEQPKKFSVESVESLDVLEPISTVQASEPLRQEERFMLSEKKPELEKCDQEAAPESVSVSTVAVDQQPSIVEEKPVSLDSEACMPLEEEVQLEPSEASLVTPAESKLSVREVAYQFPGLALLDAPPPARSVDDIDDRSEDLLDALQSFGVEATLLDLVRGPTVTRYELQPARGVKVSKFTSLTNDIALALAARSIRIEAPIPGKSAIGIEIPNDQVDMVVIQEILDSPEFRKTKGLSIALGKDLTGRPVMSDLSKMPHMLVAGTTGSGKSVCVNGMIVSLLYRFAPSELQIVMIDPKQVEMAVYEGIPHLIGFDETARGEIIVEPKKAAVALNQLVDIMESRYKEFRGQKVRNIEEFNASAEEPMPWIVVIIDELADLMMVASKTVETSICRLAQKARAAGIHMVVATQRPSADVVTGLIKVNIPSRAAFAVSSQVDSRVILDTSGAEHLLGKGDMLFLPVDKSSPMRLQGSFVSNEEIQRVVEFWQNQEMPPNRIVLSEASEDEEMEGGDEPPEFADDPLLEQALQSALSRGGASASMFQTEMRVGYSRARRILFQLEAKGWIGSQDGSKPRMINYGAIPERLKMDVDGL